MDDDEDDEEEEEEEDDARSVFARSGRDSEHRSSIIQSGKLG
jgi:hypothetical protein